MTQTAWQPGLIALHGNKTETLADTVLGWLQAHPLQALEPEVVLVQSNGMAEWFKMRTASHMGVCAAAKVELPARFVWRSFRQILGPDAVPRESPLDKTPMTWRLMRILPQCLHDPLFEPIANFLRPGEPQRLYQLAERLADLFDQYQIYRGDWLDAWERGEDTLPNFKTMVEGVPQGQLWQPALWRKVLEELAPEERALTRPALLAKVLDFLQSGQKPAKPLARRVVVFGMSQMPLSLMQFFSAVALHSQVLIAVPNPCRFHWADAISGRELLAQQRRRHAHKNGKNLADIPLEAMHAHAHPLLAAWGKQSRDYVRQLDSFDTTENTKVQWNWPRVDVYDERDAMELADAPLLEQVQQRIRDLVPLTEHPRLQVPVQDQSIVFHTAHGLVRELEVLHDQLLHLLAQPAPAGKAPLAPRDIVVMLPAIEEAAPAIRAVFGQYGRHDPRYIPFDIADVGAKASSPLVTALQWLLKLPQQRCRLSELCDLLDVPAVAKRIGLDADDLPQLTQWMSGAGIRWGLNHAQRAKLGLQACGDPNSAWFGLQRMVLGYASGSIAQQADKLYAEIEPYDEVGGLSAELAGSLATLLQRLLHWWRMGSAPAKPAEWAELFRALLDDFFLPRTEEDQALVSAFSAALEQWQQACESAEFDDAIPLEVAQEAWLQVLDAPTLEQRFRAGGVTFCTLMPMRAIPFEVVCLLGMNDGDYPRRASRADFDLMAEPARHRPGDRARRDDDRQLMLDALLSARRMLYISWAGRSVRDNSEQPPSVLVSQLRDYLAAGWCADGEADCEVGTISHQLLAQRTHHHPLQPFSRRYFEAGATHQTYAREWHAAHDEERATPDTVPAPAPFVPDPAVPLTVTQLIRFLRDPAKAYLRNRLLVSFEQEEEVVANEELFQIDGLHTYNVVQTLQTQVATLLAESDAPVDVQAHVRSLVQRMARAGALPMAGWGERDAKHLQNSTVPSLWAWQEQTAKWPVPAPRKRLQLQESDVLLDDWVEGVRQAHAGDGESIPRCWLHMTASNLTKKGQVRSDKLLEFYVRALTLSAVHHHIEGCVVARDCVLHLQPMPVEQAQAQLQALVGVWRAGQNAPLPLPRKTGLAMAAGGEKKAMDAYEAESWGTGMPAECQEPAWARCYPQWSDLIADGQLPQLAQTVYGSLLQWQKDYVLLATLPSSAPQVEVQA